MTNTPAEAPAPDALKRLVEADRNKKALYLDMEDVEHLADEITRLTAENERLREVLESVLSLAESYLNVMPDRHGIHLPKLEAARAELQEPRT